MRITTNAYICYFIKKPKNTIPAYPQGLYLYKIEYPFFETEPKDYFL